MDTTHDLTAIADLYASLPDQEVLDLHRMYLRSARADGDFVFVRLALLEDELVRRGHHDAAVANILAEEQ